MIDLVTVATRARSASKRSGSSYRDGDQGGQGEVGDAQTDRHDGTGPADQGVADPSAQDRHRQEGGCQGQPPVLAASPGFAGAVPPGQVDHYQDQGDGEKRQAHRCQGRRQWPGHRPEHMRRRLVGWQERTRCRGGSEHEHGGVEEDHGEQPAAQTRPEPALGEEQQRQGHDHVEQDPGALTGCGHVVGSGRRSRHVLRQHFGEQQRGVQTRQHQKHAEHARLVVLGHEHARSGGHDSQKHGRRQDQQMHG